MENINKLNAEINNEKLFDLCMIDRLCRGNQEQVKKMIKVFVEKTPKDMEEIKSAYKQNDFVQLKKLAHRIKPVLSYYAIIKIEKDVQLIELMSDKADAGNELESRLKKIDDVLSKVVEQLKALC